MHHKPDEVKCMHDVYCIAAYSGSLSLSLQRLAGLVLSTVVPPYLQFHISWF